jgi:GNAT superfamily N-acetyltransferase
VRTTERIELLGARDLFAVAPPELGALVDTAGTAVALRVPALAQIVELNRIVGLSSLEELDELEPAFGRDRVTVCLDPGTGLADALVRRGYERGYAWHKFVRGTEPLEARTELEIEDATDGPEYGATFVGGYGLPSPMSGWLGRIVGRAGWHCFVARETGRAVACGAVFVDGDAGWCGGAATLPSHRGRGAQGALFAARIRRAAELGLATLVTETGAPRDGAPGPSYRNMLRAGFELAYERPNYVRQAEAPE